MSSIAAADPPESAPVPACSDECDENACVEPEPREPCPTPLAWQQVVGTFLEERERHLVTVGRHRLLTWTWGDPAAPPLVLLGGMTTTPETLSLLAYLLREEFRCIVVDDPSVDEPGRARFRSLTDFAGDLLAAADVVGAERFSVVGIGWGSTVALRTMIDRGERIERAILVGGYARLRLSWLERMTFRLGRWWPGRLASVPMQRVMTEQNHRRWFPPFDHTRWEFLEAQTARVPVGVAAVRASSVVNEDLRSRLGEVPHPVLLVRGEGEGRMATARWEELAAGLPNARTEWMHSTGQLSYLTHPHRLAKFVKSFHTEATTPVNT